jgi:hypothetical protein
VGVDAKAARRRVKGAPVPAFVSIDVEPGPASADGVSLRFKQAGDPRTVSELPYESEDGLEGTWRVWAVDGADEAGRDATAVLVDDSSDGVAWLIVGGRHGLVLEHAATRERRREPYLLLSKSLRF